MADFATLQTKVQRRVIDLPQAVQDEVPDLVNYAHRAIQREHNFRVMEAVQSVTTAPLTRILAQVPADFKELRDVPTYITFDGVVQRLGVAPNRSAVEQGYDTQADSFPRHLLRSEPTDALGTTNWEVWPLSDANSDYGDGEYRIRIPYWKFLPSLTASGDTDWFTVNAEDYIVARATAEGFALDWDTEHQTEWLGKATDFLGEVVKLDKFERLAGVDTLVPHRGGAWSPRLDYRR